MNTWRVSWNQQTIRLPRRFPHLLRTISTFDIIGRSSAERFTRRLKCELSEGVHVRAVLPRLLFLGSRVRPVSRIRVARANLSRMKKRLLRVVYPLKVLISNTLQCAPVLGWWGLGWKSDSWLPWRYPRSFGTFHLVVARSLFLNWVVNLQTPFST